MANRFARKAGNWNASDVWSDTPSGTAGAQFIPVAGDVAVANGFIVTVNVSAECAEARTDTTGGAAGGGRFTLSDGVTLTANCYAGSSICVYYGGSASASVIGNITGGSSNGHGANNANQGTLSITGNVVGGSSAQGAYNGSTGTIAITGNVTGSSAGSFCGAYNNSTGTITISGNAIGGAGSNAYGASNASTGTMRVGRAIGNDHGPGYATNNGTPGVFGYGTNSGGQPTTTVGGITFGAYGQAPVAGRVLVDPSLLSSLTAILIRETTLAQIVCTGPDNTSADPAEANVRYGTSYRFGAKTGTCRVPGASSVLTGVLVDNTTGTAAVGAADIRAALGLASANLDTQILNLRDQVEYNRGHHTVAGNTFYVDGVGGNDTTGTGTRLLPYKTITKALTACAANTHDQILLLPNAAGGPTQITETGTITVNKSYVQIRGPGRDVEVIRSTNGKVFNITASGVELSGFRVTTTGGGSSDAVEISGAVDFARLHRLWIESAHRDAVFINVANRCEIVNCTIVAPARDGVRVGSGAGNGSYNSIMNCVVRDAVGSAINLQGSDASDCRIQCNVLRDNTVGITISSGVTDTVVTDNRMVNNATTINDLGTRTLQAWNFLSTDMNGALTALATDVVNSSTLAANAVTEIQSGLATMASIGALNNLSAQQVWEYVTRTLTDKTGYALTVDYDAAKSAASQASVTAIPTMPLLAVNYTAPANADIAAIKAKTDNIPTVPAASSEVSAVWSAIAALHDFDPALDIVARVTLVDTTTTLTNVPGVPTEVEIANAVWESNPRSLTDKANFALTSDYDAAKTAASQSSVDAIPVTPLLATNYIAPPTAAAIRAEIDANSTKLDVAISTRLAAAGYTAPANTDIAAIKSKTDNIPALPASSADVSAVSSAVAALHDFDPATDTVAHVALVDATTALTNAPDVPTEAEIANAVWGAVTRTLTSGAGGATPQEIWEYAIRTLTHIPNIPTEVEIANAVRNELLSELAIIEAIEERIAEQVPTGPVIVIEAPEDESQTIAWTMCYGPDGLPEEGVVITITCVKSVGIGSFDRTPVVITSVAGGLAQGAIQRGAGLRFVARRGTTGSTVRFFGVDADTLQLPATLGTP